MHPQQYVTQTELDFLSHLTPSQGAQKDKASMWSGNDCELCCLQRAKSYWEGNVEADQKPDRVRDKSKESWRNLMMKSHTALA